MRCQVLLLTVLSLVVTKASAEIVADPPAPVQLKKEKKQTDEEEDGKVPERDLAAVAPTTAKPIQWHKIIGPVAGGVVGAGALAGVIAVSVMNAHSTTKKPALKQKITNEALPTAQVGPFESKVSELTAPVAAGASKVDVVNQAGFTIGDHVILDQGTPKEESNYITSFGSIMLRDPLQFPHTAGAKIMNVAPLPGQITTPVPAGAATDGSSLATDGSSLELTGSKMWLVGIGCGLCACCLVLLVCALIVQAMKGKKKTRKPSKEVYSPMDRDEEQPLTKMPPPPPMMDPSYQSQYLPVGGMESQYMPVAPSGFGAMPTLDVVPMQTMPPTMFNAPVTTAFAAPSPLAQTQNAVLAGAAIPTINNMRGY